MISHLIYFPQKCYLEYASPEVFPNWMMSQLIYFRTNVLGECFPWSVSQLNDFPRYVLLMQVFLRKCFSWSVSQLVDFPFHLFPVQVFLRKWFPWSVSQLDDFQINLFPVKVFLKKCFSPEVFPNWIISHSFPSSHVHISQL